MADRERGADEQLDGCEHLDGATQAEAPAESERRLEGLLSYLPDGTTPARPEPVPAGLRSAELVELDARGASVRLRGMTSVLSALVAPEVDTAFLERARHERQRVLVEVEPGHEPVIVGVIQIRQPEHLRLAANVIEIEAKESLTLRSGRAGLRLRKDGDVELIGTRISAASRGLMRLVGRVLRLN